MRRLRQIWRFVSGVGALYAGSIVVRHEIRAHFRPLEIVFTAVMLLVAVIAVSE